jgi:peptide chain release factor 2
MEPEITQLKKRMSAIRESLDLEALSSRKGELETKSMEPDFWKDQVQAKKIMKEISIIEETLESLHDISVSVDNLSEYWELLKESCEVPGSDFKKEIADVKEKLDAFELRQFLSGKYDKDDALLSIHAGQGGTEANDWAEMLMRMYLRYAESQGWKTDVIHMIKGDEAGITTATIEITGPYAYGYLKGEHGTHRLVRLSPFNAQKLRQTSFAGIEVLPVIEGGDEDDIDINPDELEFKAVRASGPGGQHVNKTSTAVTLTHKPTGITVHSSSQRSQHQNRESAMKLLKAKLWEIEEQEREAEEKELKGEHKAASWGNQIRNYVLHPYKLVKDLRTGIEHSNPEAVLDGGLERFIQAEVREDV